MKVLRCRDAGVNCDWVGKGKTEDEVLKLAAEHGRKAHGMKEISPDMLAKTRAAIRDE
jgi:predicted small metal-binding protein